MEKYTFDEIQRKLRRMTSVVCGILELVVAAVVIAGVALAVLSLFPEIANLWEEHVVHEAFMEFLENVLTVVVGIEFLKMLCRTSSDNVLETIIFLVARHMIVNTTTPVEDLLSTISIVLLCLVRRYLNNTRNRESRKGVFTELLAALLKQRVPAEETTGGENDGEEEHSSEE